MRVFRGSDGLSRQLCWQRTPRSGQVTRNREEAGYFILLSRYPTPSAIRGLPRYLIFTGGPGGSGVQAVAGLAPIFAHHFQGSFDIVSWDARGVGLTSWVHVVVSR